MWCHVNDILKVLEEKTRLAVTGPNSNASHISRIVSFDIGKVHLAYCVADVNYLNGKI